MSMKQYPSFYDQIAFSAVEAMCLISGDHPVEIAEQYGQPYFADQFPRFVEAEQLILNAIALQKLPKKNIAVEQLKEFLLQQGYHIEGFHTELEKVC